MMEDERCCCCGRDFESLHRHSSRRKGKSSSRAFKVGSEEMVKWIEDNRVSICQQKGYPIRLELEVSHETRICAQCRTSYLNSVRKTSRVRGQSRTPNASSGSDTEGSSRDNSQEPQTDVVSGSSLYAPQTSRGNRPPPLDIQEMTESFSEASLTPSVREFAHRSKFPRFNSPDRADPDSSSDEEPNRSQRTPSQLSRAQSRAPQPSQSSRRSNSLDSDGEPRPGPSGYSRSCNQLAETRQYTHSSSSGDDSPISSSDESSSTSSSGEEYNPPAERPRREISGSNIRATTSSGSSCVFGCRAMRHSRVISEKMRISCIIQHELFIPLGTRCCRSHPDTVEQYSQLRRYREITFEESLYITGILRKLRLGQMNLKVPELDESNDEYFKFWTKLTSSDFRDLMTRLPSLSNKKKEQELFVFLLKMRHNFTDGEIARLFQISDSTVRRWYTSTTEAFKTDLIVRDLGTREFGCAQSSIIANETLLGDRDNPHGRLIVIADGGYIYHQASSSFAYQLRSFSSQKKSASCETNALSVSKWVHTRFAFNSCCCEQ